MASNEKIEKEETPPPAFSEEDLSNTIEGGPQPPPVNMTTHPSHLPEQMGYEFPNVGELPVPNVNPMTAHVSSGLIVLTLVPFSYPPTFLRAV